MLVMWSLEISNFLVLQLARSLDEGFFFLGDCCIMLIDVNPRCDDDDGDNGCASKGTNLGAGSRSKSTELICKMHRLLSLHSSDRISRPYPRSIQLGPESALSTGSYMPLHSRCWSTEALVERNQVSLLSDNLRDDRDRLSSPFLASVSQSSTFHLWHVATLDRPRRGETLPVLHCLGCLSWWTSKAPSPRPSGPIHTEQSPDPPPATWLVIAFVRAIVLVELL